MENLSTFSIVITTVVKAECQGLWTSFFGFFCVCVLCNLVAPSLKLTIAVKSSARTFSPPSPQAIEAPYLLAVKETMGDRYTITMEQAHTATIRFVIATLAAGVRGDGGDHATLVQAVTIDGKAGSGEGH